ncbi:orotate phosphoribosyltransferase [Tilletiaria anomala UBC 951]|uniref:orotate phosphoribosyltransferase n=1 Tax=Tilletiaria anomala (strain ATCC 24038 / CBS 436.72 / UBC 951) TaxID=1037660 RepID=A0A066VN15_TILAU|nr:orotate phosphoribosyltransferase [Tilletiaria anomala UBC 951]KDN41683.1 orotate phosphoribosyltransferase [Tilletiaria anomala UBC 951]
MSAPKSKDNTALEAYQTSYLSLSLSSGILSFDGAPYTLKSGRKSPYFFNAGLFNTGTKIDAVASCYASAIVNSGVQFDVLFGPAYKGIPLAACTALALSRDHGIDVGFCYNRKEAKTHGEGGTLVGAPLQGRVLVIDDVMTAGTAIGEAVSIIENAAKTNAAKGDAAAETKMVGIVIALDRQERATEESPESTVSMVQRRYGVPVVPVVTLADIITYIESLGGEDNEKAIQGMKEYRQKYGAQ